MNRKIRNGFIIAGISTLGLLGMAAVTDVKMDDNRIRVYAAESATDAGENTVSEWDVDVNSTIYNVGSVSKVYVTVAVMQLVDQGKVDLDAPVTDYIKDFKMADERYKDITVRMLMNHTAGFMGTVAKNGFLLNDAVSNREKDVLDCLAKQRLKADPGAYSCYSNDGFDLLMIIVERVTGKDYTTYVEENIADKIGATTIGTPLNLYGNENLTEVYSNNRRYGKEYVMDLGAGGIYSNAADTCEFGSTFFKGDNRLLSEESKDEMNTLATDTKYSSYGLGWDETDIPMYEDAGVKVVTKGGDSLAQHTELIVAPDEEISVCVVTSGGNSGESKAMAEALMNIALEEEGIEVTEPSAPEVELKSEVPEEYKKYEGWYVSGFLGGIYEITFPDMKYMLVKSGVETTKEMYFKYTDKGFVKVTGDIETDNVKVDPDYECYTYEEINGKAYVVVDMISNDTYLINRASKSIVAESLDINPVSESVINAWKDREDKKYALFSDKYSSYMYDMPFSEIHVIDDTGYVYIMNKETPFILKIEDEDTVVAFSTIPGDGNRDIYDAYVDEDGIIHTSNGYSLVPLDKCDTLTGDVESVSLVTECTTWYNIDDSLANTAISLERPENSAVYVYDKFGDVIYSSHMKGYGDTIPLPKGGYIAFLGEDGGTISIKNEQ